MKIVITGIAGFIGFHLARQLHGLGHEVSGLDNFNDYYDQGLKAERKRILQELNIPVLTRDIRTMTKYDLLDEKHSPVDLVIHLAAWAGVRHSFDHEAEYIDNNINGTANLIESIKKAGIKNVIFASTSCVMAGNPLPWKEDEKTGHQLNPYGYTKHVNECQFTMLNNSVPGMNIIGLRFFTVYGPYGRPDMALFTFADQLLAGEKLTVFNNGDMKRDFTYVADIVNGIETLIGVRAINGFEIFNIGRGEQVQLMDFIGHIENELGVKGEYEFKPKHPADTQETWSDTSKLQSLGWKPTTSIAEGVHNFIAWYKTWRNI